MQINYPYAMFDRSGYAPMWYPPDIDLLRDLDIPPVYAPYPARGFWPPSYTPAALSGLGFPAPTPAAAGVSATTLSPISLLTPMPSITKAALGSVLSSDAPMPPAADLGCSIAAWVNQNPLLATLAGVGVYFLIAKGGRK